MVVLKYLVYILLKRNAAVFHNVCPQLLFVVRTVEHNAEDLGPHNPLNYSLRCTWYSEKSNSFLQSIVYS